MSNYIPKVGDVIIDLSYAEVQVGYKGIVVENLHPNNDGLVYINWCNGPKDRHFVATHKKDMLSYTFGEGLAKYLLIKQCISTRLVTKVLF